MDGGTGVEEEILAEMTELPMFWLLERRPMFWLWLMVMPWEKIWRMLLPWAEMMAMFCLEKSLMEMNFWMTLEMMEYSCSWGKRNSLTLENCFPT